MAFIQRYSAIRKGGIIFVGNTLGLSKYTNANRAGLLGSIGAFTSLDTSLKVNDFPNGTTLDYRLNGSAAILNIPAGSGVLYAELVWGRIIPFQRHRYIGGAGQRRYFYHAGKRISRYGRRGDERKFRHRAGKQHGRFLRPQRGRYLAGAGGGSGVYSLSSVPALIEAIDSRTNDTNHAGWTLAVVYENPDKAFESLTLWVGGEVVSPLTGVTDITLTGFKTPQTAAPAGRLYVSAGRATPSSAATRCSSGKARSLCPTFRA